MATARLNCTNCDASTTAIVIAHDPETGYAAVNIAGLDWDGSDKDCPHSNYRVGDIWPEDLRVREFPLSPTPAEQK